MGVKTITTQSVLESVGIIKNQIVQAWKIFRKQVNPSRIAPFTVTAYNVDNTLIYLECML